MVHVMKPSFLQIFQVLVFTLILGVGAVSAAGDVGSLPVIPGAVGFGIETPAGRGGQIIKVVNLNGRGEGSLRAAIEVSGPRLVVFEVAGAIELITPLEVSSPFITIAGQTAPPPGITLQGAGITVNSHDVLIQHLRIRVGDNPSGPSPSSRDGIQILGPRSFNVILDHLSVSWGIDENVSTWGDVDGITIRNCIVSEALRNSLHKKGPHSMGMLIGDGANNIMIANNLLAHNVERNPIFKGGTSAIMVNNLFYNPGANSFSTVTDDKESGPSYVSSIGNLFLKGPNTTAPVAMKIGKRAAPGTLYYHEDNLAPGMKLFRDHFDFTALVDNPPLSLRGLNALKGRDTESSVLLNAGARPAERDDVDARVVEEVRSRTGRHIDTPSQVASGKKKVRTFRSFPDLSDPHGDEDSDGYTNIEEILHLMSEEVTAIAKQ